jgi:hypothetical protein
MNCSLNLICFCFPLLLLFLLSLTFGVRPRVGTVRDLNGPMARSACPRGNPNSPKQTVQHVHLDRRVEDGLTEGM